MHILVAILCIDALLRDNGNPKVSTLHFIDKAFGDSLGRSEMRWEGSTNIDLTSSLVSMDMKTTVAGLAEHSVSKHLTRLRVASKLNTQSAPMMKSGK